MSDDKPFQLEWPGKEPEASDTPARTGGPSPRKIAGLKRTAASARRERRPRRAGRPTAAPAGGRLARTRRAGRRLIAPPFFYVLGAVVIGALIPILFNPGFGGVAKAWPHVVLGLDGGTFAWNHATVILIKLIVVALACLIALARRPSTGSAVTVLFAVAVAVLAWPLPASALGWSLLPLGIAFTVGALQGGRSGRWLLLAGFLVLAAVLFVPTPEATARAYDSTGLQTIRAYLDPPPTGDPADPYAVPIDETGLLGVVVHHLPATTGILVLALALLGLVGLGRAWAGPTGALLLLLLWAGTLVALYLHGQGGGSWQDGLRYLGRHAHANPLVYALPLAAAVAEWIHVRRP